MPSICDRMDLLRVDRDRLKSSVISAGLFFCALGVVFILAGGYIAVTMVRYPSWGPDAASSTLLIGCYILAMSGMGTVSAMKEWSAMLYLHVNILWAHGVGLICLGVGIMMYLDTVVSYVFPRISSSMPLNWREDCDLVTSEEKADLVDRYDLECYSAKDYAKLQQMNLVIGCMVMGSVCIILAWFVSNLRNAIYENKRIAEQVAMRQLLPLVATFAELPLMPLFAQSPGNMKYVLDVWLDQIIRHINLGFVCTTMHICSLEDGDSAAVLFHFCQAIVVRNFLHIVEQENEYKRIMYGDPELHKECQQKYDAWQNCQAQHEVFITHEEIFDFWFDFFDHVRTHYPSSALGPRKKKAPALREDEHAGISCKKCGLNISSDQLYCPDCGTPVPEGAFS